MWKSKRALPPSSSSGQPSQPKRPCFPPIDQAWNGSEMNPVPSCCLTCCLTKEDLRSMLREELEHAKSDLAENFQSCIRNALKDIVPQMRSENDFQRLEAVEPANSHSPHLGRGNAKSTANNGVRNLKLQLQTKLSLPLFTGKKIEGEEGVRIYVTLIDANTGGVVSSGPESSMKLDLVVLEGDFNKDDQDNWAPEEFENYVVKERTGKGPLLIGDLVVKLNKGVGELGELIFADNSCWNRSKRYRIGVKVASGFCGNTRIQEAVTDAFPVKEHRGEAYMKHHPPASDDEVWRSENIAKGGKSHQKLSDAGIYKVEDFLLQLFTDPEKLREILGKSMAEKKRDSLIRHVKTFKTKWKHPDGVTRHDATRHGATRHGAVFNTDGQLIGLVKDREYFATHRLSAQEKEHGDEIVKMALANSNDVREFNGETFSDSMRLNSVQRYLAPPIFPAPVGLEAPPANVSSTAEGLNGAMALALPVQSQNTNSGTSMKILVDENFHLAAHQLMSPDHLNVQIPPGYHDSTTAGLSTQSHGLNLQNSMHSQMIGSSSQMDYTGHDDVLLEGNHVMENHTPWNDLFSRTLALPEGNYVTEDIQSINYGAFEQWLADDLSHVSLYDDPLNDDRCVSVTSRGATGWLKIKAVLQWGYFSRKRGVRIVELN